MRLPDSIPPLRGWARRLFVIVWSLLLIVQLGANVMAFVTFKPWQTHSPEQMIGLKLDRSPDNASVVITQTIGEEAVRAGIVKGDTVLSIDGRPPALRYNARGNNSRGQSAPAWRSKRAHPPACAPSID